MVPLVLRPVLKVSNLKCRCNTCSHIYPLRSNQRHLFLGPRFLKTNEVQRYRLVRAVNATPAEVFGVVTDIDKYSSYMPYCLESKVYERDPKTNEPTVGSLRIGVGHYDETFVCNVRCLQDPVPQIYKVDAESITNHLFKKLRTKWTIMPHPKIPNHSKVELQLSFQFHSVLYNSLSSVFGNSLTMTAMDTFAQRFNELKK